MNSASSLPTRDITAGVARPLIFAFGALLAALFLAAVISGLIVRELREPLEYASESAFTVAAKLRNIHEAADELDLLITQTGIDTQADANPFARKITLMRERIDTVLRELPPVSLTGVDSDVLYEQRNELFASLDEMSELAAKRWARQKRADALGAQIVGTTDTAIEMTRDHNARFASNNTSMKRTLGEIRYHLSSMNNFAEAALAESDLGAIDDAANLYALNLRGAVSSLSRLPEYAERVALFNRAQELFDLGHSGEGYYGTARQSVLLQRTLEASRQRYEQVSNQFRDSIKRLATLNDEVTAKSLNSARTGLGRYQALLIASIIATLLAGTLVIKRYVFDAVVLPLRSLRDATLRMAGGNLETPFETRGDDEISDLAQALSTFRSVSVERERSEQRLKERTEELERVNHELDEFAYVASHDLRAPLHGIDSLASFIQEDMEGKLPEESARHLNLMRARIQRLHTLLDSLLEFSRVGKDNAQPVWVQLDTLITSSAMLVDSPDFELVFSVDKEEVLLATTPFEQLVRNLVDNAIKHHDRDSGCIHISASVKDRRIHLEVADDGPGIPPKFHDRVFGMFQTLQARDKIEGSGMGLALLRKSVSYFGGNITLRSDPEQARGTTFVVDWPVVDQRPVEEH